MFKKLMGRIHQEERGITGLETAIILIAFVVVASVFAYTVLGAGLFAAERGKEAVHAGLDVARATVTLSGGIVARGNTTGNVTAHHVNQLVFIVSQAVGGEPVNFAVPTNMTADGRAGTNSPNVVVISYIDPYQHVSNLFWNMTRIGRADADDLLEADEKFQITIPGLAEALHVNRLGVDRTFTIKVMPPIGAVLTLERTIPPVIDRVMDLR